MLCLDQYLYFLISCQIMAYTFNLKKSALYNLSQQRHENGFLGDKKRGQGECIYFQVKQLNSVAKEKKKS